MSVKTCIRFDVITLFPELFELFQQIGIVRRAFEIKAVELKIWQLRDFAENTYKRVDDRPYGGGPGMVLMIQPLERALEFVRKNRVECGVISESELPVILFSPAGKLLTQQRVQAFINQNQNQGAILICGRYEGIDQRFIDRYVNEEISLGDFVLSGGELPALSLLDAILRLLPGVLNNECSHQQDSFSNGLLDYPHYTRPRYLFDGKAHADVPAVLFEGNHQKIFEWRHNQSIDLTKNRRPDLFFKKP
jgi:tRNA (guanine37-N1)-methyltransferase